MTEDKEQHGHTKDSHDDAGERTEEALLPSFLVVVGIVLVLGWLTQPGPGTTTAAAPEPETPAAAPAPQTPTVRSAPDIGPPASTVAAGQREQEPIPSAAAEPSAEPMPEASAAPEVSAEPEASAAPEPAEPATSAAPTAAGAAPGGGGAFNRIAALTALGKSAQAAGRCRSAGAAPGNAKVIVAFAPDGHVSSARILSAKYVGTPTGNCILGHIKKTTLAPFAGGKPATVVTTVHVY